MKKIILSKGKIAIVDDDDFRYLSKHKWYCSTFGYVVRYETGKDHDTRKKLYMQRVIMKAGFNKEVDHINRNKLDNRKRNLRICTSSENRLNRTVQKNSKMNLKDIGIQRVKSGGKIYKYYVVRIQLNGKRFRWFKKNLREAIFIRNKKIRELHGENESI